MFPVIVLRSPQVVDKSNKNTHVLSVQAIEDKAMLAGARAATAATAAAAAAVTAADTAADKQLNAMQD